MSIVQRVLRFLGLDRPTLEDGFTLDERGSRAPVCDTCGAVVAYQSQTVHTRWHRG